VSEVALTADGERALKEAENYCWRTNVAIVAPEHLLAGALLVLTAAGYPGAPSAEQLDAAVLASQGSGSEELSTSVMFGSGARMALNHVAAGVRGSGGTQVTALAVAAGTIDSGEVNPMFFGTLGTTKRELLQALAGA
jgi:hypothetical protein